MGLLFIKPTKIKCLQLLSIKHHNFSGYLSAWAWVIESTKYFGLEAMLIGHTIFMSSASRVFFFFGAEQSYFIRLSNKRLYNKQSKCKTTSEHKETNGWKALIHLCHSNQRPISAIQRWRLAQILYYKKPKLPNCEQKNLHPSDKRDAPAV